MVSVCLKCGSEGFPEWLVYCNQCQVYALHRYCLDGPVIFDDDVTWFCEDCEAEVTKPASPDNSAPLPCGTSHNVNLAKDTIQASLELKHHKKRVKKNNHVQKKNMMKQKKTKDTSGFVDQRKVPLSDCHHKNHIKRAKKMNHKREKTIMKMKKETDDISGFVSKSKEPLSDYHTSQRDQIQCSVPLSDCHPSPVCDQTQSSDNFEDHERFVKFCALSFGDTANSKKESDSLLNAGVAVHDDLNTVELDSCAEARPIPEPIWRGSFFIRNLKIGGTFSGLVAHLSSLACSKVLDETKLFPEVLCADLLYRSSVWPKGFQELGPTDQSIALYIFPDTERDEKIFDKLVDEIISSDLAIRAEVENAEFLVFPSTVLPAQHWRFQAKYYLWGVFRGKQASRTNNDVS